jgi:hypothetical protein
MKYTNETDRYKAVIEEDEAAGFYLYIYDLKSGKCLFDHLQDTLAITINQAFRDFGFDKNSWKELSDT